MLYLVLNCNCSVQVFTGTSRIGGSISSFGKGVDRFSFCLSFFFDLSCMSFSIWCWCCCCLCRRSTLSRLFVCGSVCLSAIRLTWLSVCLPVGANEYVCTKGNFYYHSSFPFSLSPPFSFLSLKVSFFSSSSFGSIVSQNRERYRTGKNVESKGETERRRRRARGQGNGNKKKHRRLIPFPPLFLNVQIRSIDFDVYSVFLCQLLFIASALILCTFNWPFLTGLTFPETRPFL